jgi:uncharacterized protein YdeI (YjbR/CyaY-like superfamily)
MKPVYFKTPSELRRWLARNHAKAGELWVGFHRRATGRPSVTWPQVVDECLCFGWIDGLRRGVDDERYVIRLTPRKPRSRWSDVNVRRAHALIAAGRMKPAGRRAFDARDAEDDRAYSYERQNAALSPPYARRLKASPAAWRFYQAQAPWYRRSAAWWVMSAKREDTRERRLATLIADSARGMRVGPLRQRPASEA